MNKIIFNEIPTALQLNSEDILISVNSDSNNQKIAPEVLQQFLKDNTTPAPIIETLPEYYLLAEPKSDTDVNESEIDLNTPIKFYYATLEDLTSQTNALGTLFELAEQIYNGLQCKIHVIWGMYNTQTGSITMAPDNSETVGMPCGAAYLPESVSVRPESGDYTPDAPCYEFYLYLQQIRVTKTSSIVRGLDYTMTSVGPDWVYVPIL